MLEWPGEYFGDWKIGESMSDRQLLDIALAAGKKKRV
jgi:hypothetical protein